MAANLGELRIKVIGRVKDAVKHLSAVAGGDYDQALADALSEYSKHKPRETCLKVVGSGAFRYAVPAGYVDGFSSILSIEYPWAATNRGQAPLDESDYRLVRLDADDGGLMLELLSATPASGETLLVKFTLPHTLDGTTSTVPASDDEALVNLAAANACDTLATKYAQSTDPSIQADSVDRLSKSREYAARANAFRKRFREAMQLGEGQDDAVRAASGIADLDSPFRDGTDRFFHGSRFN